MTTKKPIAEPEELRKRTRKERQDIKESFVKAEKAVMSKLEEETRKIDEIKKDDPQVVEKELIKKIQDIKEEVESKLEALQLATTGTAPKSKGKTDTASQSSSKPEMGNEWRELDLKLEGILENAAQKHKVSEFEKLKDELSRCLLCFSIFPQEAIIKKRTMIYWWIGEDFVKETDGKTAEENGENIFEELIKCNWIDPVDNKSSMIVRECTIDPWVRWLLICKAREQGAFDIDDRGVPSPSPSKSYRACLVSTKNQDQLKSDISNTGKSNHQDQEGSSKEGSGKKGSKHPDREGSSKEDQLLTVFNVNTQRLNTQHLYARDLFTKPKMKRLAVLQLGRWQSSAEHHIELEDEDSELFQKLGVFLKSLRFLSLAGISRIRKLPTSIKELHNLLILDLRGCQNLEKLGVEVTYLKKLTHLDVSECYLLDHMPKGLGSLTYLEVLKGFVVGSLRSSDSCRLADLTKLKKLKKLSISIGSEAQIHHDDMAQLEQIESLHSLAIIWGMLSNVLHTDGKENLKKEWEKLSFPPKLEKLDLRCFPEADVPDWLEPARLKNLKKLYIRGGKLQKLNIHNKQETDEARLEVDTLRLKFLEKLDMEWAKVGEFFPKLTYLEIHKCPKLKECPPLDKHGIWLGNVAATPILTSTTVTPNSSQESIPPTSSQPSESVSGADVTATPTSTSTIATPTSSQESIPPTSSQPSESVSGADVTATPTSTSTIATPTSSQESIPSTSHPSGSVSGTNVVATPTSTSTATTPSQEAIPPTSQPSELVPGNNVAATLASTSTTAIPNSSQESIPPTSSQPSESVSSVDVVATPTSTSTIATPTSSQESIPPTSQPLESVSGTNVAATPTSTSTTTTPSQEAIPPTSLPSESMHGTSVAATPASTSTTTPDDPTQSSITTIDSTKQDLVPLSLVPESINTNFAALTSPTHDHGLAPASTITTDSPTPPDLTSRSTDVSSLG